MKSLLVMLVLLAGEWLVGWPVSLAAERLIAADKVQDLKQERPKLFVLAIGVANFEDDFWPDLKWPEDDAKRVAESFGLNTDRQRMISVLTGNKVSLQSIDRELDKIARQADRRDSVAIYISTHGTLALDKGKDLEQILVLPDTTSKNLAKTGLAIATLRRKLEVIPASRKLLILAACHSGIGKSRLTPLVQEALSGAKGKLESLDEVSEGVLVLSAAARGETAREDDQLRSDIYTYYFLEGLKSFDRDQDGAVSALEAHDYAKDRAYARSGGKQRATLEAQEIGKADIVLQGSVKRRALPVLEARGEELAGLMIRIDNGAKGRLPNTVALRPKASTVRLYRATEEKPFVSYKVSAPRGTRIDLDDVLAGQPWLIGIGSGAVTLHNKNARRLLGNQLRASSMLAGYRVMPRWSLGLELDWINPQQLDLDSSIKAKLSWNTGKILSEYHYSSSYGLDLGIGLAIGRDWARLSLSDNSQTLSYGATVVSVRPRLVISWTTKWGLGLRLAASHTTGVFDFGDPGHIDTRRSELMLYAIYRFGGYARRL